MAEARRPLVVGNWKMNTTVPEAVALAEGLLRLLPAAPAAEIAVLPPFISIWPVHLVLADDPRVEVGAQDCYWQPPGAFTGAVAAAMLQPPCHHVLVGHSERRQLFGDSDEVVRLKLEAVLRAGLNPLLAVGETLEQRDRGETEAVVKGQCRFALKGLGAQGLGNCTVAYEPIWAIGTGQTASPADAEQAAGWIREVLAETDSGVAARARVLYGGSVTAESAAAMLAPAGVDGALVGGASLDAAQFCGIVGAAAPGA